MVDTRLRGVKTTRHRIEQLLNKAKIRLGPKSIGTHKMQSHGFIRVQDGNQHVIKSIVANLGATFDDFEFQQENFKNLVVVRFRTKGSKGWYEG